MLFRGLWLFFRFRSLIYPPLFTWFQGTFITLGLGGIMLGMGLTLQTSDFKQIISHPKWVLLGIALQFILMPHLDGG